MLGLVSECKHTDKPAGGAAYKACHKQGLFLYAPFVTLGTAFVNAIHYKADYAYDTYIA